MNSPLASCILAEASASGRVPDLTIGVLFRLVWLKIEGTGSDVFYDPFTRETHLFFQKDT